MVPLTVAPAGPQGQLHRAGAQLPQGHTAVGPLHLRRQSAELLNIGVGGVQLLPQGQGDLHHHHPPGVEALHTRHHPGLHGQTHGALGAEQCLVDGGHVDAAVHQLCGNAVAAGGGVGVDEATGVRGDGHIQRQSHLRRQGRQLPEDIVHDLAAGGAVRLQTRLTGEKLLRGVVVDGQSNAVLIGPGVLRQQRQRRNVHGDHIRRCKIRLRQIGGGIGGVGGRQLRVGQQIRRFAQRPQAAAQGGSGADGVAVGADMGEDQHLIHNRQPDGGFRSGHNRHLLSPPDPPAARYRRSGDRRA